MSEVPSLEPERVEVHGFAVGDRVATRRDGPPLFGKVTSVPDWCPMAAHGGDICFEWCRRIGVETTAGPMAFTAAELEHTD